VPTGSTTLLRRVAGPLPPAWVLAGLLLVLAAGLPPLQADDPASPAPAAPSQPLSPTELAHRVDHLLAEARARAGRRAAPPASDAEFLRRIYLDLHGRIPPVAAVRAFLADDRPDKRALVVERLLDHGAHAAHFAHSWRELLLAGASGGLEARAYVPAFDAWLRLRFAAGTPYDQIMQELLIAAPAPGSARAAVDASPSPLAFYQAHEHQASQLAAGASRALLGVQVQCAECHDHPFADWKREQFWALAAFFAGLDGAAPGDGRLQIPGTPTRVAPRFLDGTVPDASSGHSKRVLLARWLTARSNSRFAKAAANRLWEHFFGRGLVHPVDHFDPANPPSHPELLDELARQFVLHDYDLKYLVRALTATRAYQLSSRAESARDDDLSHFVRMPLRRMTGDQLFDSIVQATGYRDDDAEAGARLTLVRAEFQARFSDPNVPRTETETSILQALAMMNGPFVSGAVSLSTSHTLLAVAEAPFLDTPARVETLFLATLSRPPDAEELARCAEYVQTGGPTNDSRAALADVFWALLNSAEFVLNH
jgi:hypothetical protein